jgi:hypothetical protein
MIKTHAKQSTIRYLLGISGKLYNKWSDELVINSLVFDGIEWFCFLRIYYILLDDKDYELSSEKMKYLQLEVDEDKHKEQRLLDEFKHYRQIQIRNWANSFKRSENVISAKAYEVVDLVLEMEIRRLLDLYMTFGANELVFDIQHEEQNHYEGVCANCLIVTRFHCCCVVGMVAVADEACSWATEDILDDIYDFYVGSLLTTMWSMPSLRKGMLQYSGLLHKGFNDKLMRDAKYRAEMKNVTKEPAGWFDRFLKTSTEVELTLIPPSHETAVERIQRIFRGFRDRRIARKEFVSVFLKRYDPNTQRHYYINTALGTSSWDKPKIHSLLFPNSKW